MAYSIQFNNFTIFQPGAYSKADLSALIRARVEGGGNICVIGTAFGGQPNVVYSLSDPQVARNTFRKNSILWEAIRLMYLGDNIHTANQIFAVRVGNALQSQKETYSLTEKGHITKFVARDYGAWTTGGGVRVEITASADFFLPDPDNITVQGIGGAPTLSQSATGGTVLAGTYYFRYSYLNNNGETLASPAANIVVTTGTTNKLTVTMPNFIVTTTQLTPPFNQVTTTNVTWPTGVRQVRCYVSTDGLTYYPLTTTVVNSQVMTFTLSAPPPTTGAAPLLESTANAYTCNIYTLLENGNTAIQQYDNMLTQDALVTQINSDASNDIGSVTAITIKSGFLDQWINTSLEGGTDLGPTYAFGYYYTQMDSLRVPAITSPSAFRFQSVNNGPLGTGVEIIFASDFIDPAPGAPAAVAAGTGGTLASNDYYIAYTFVNSNGETLPSPMQSVAVTGPTGSVAVTVGPYQLDAHGVVAATSIKVYVSNIAPIAAGDYSNFHFQGTVTAPGTTYTLTSFSSAGAATPTVNTAALGQKLTVTNGSVTENLRLFFNIADVLLWSNDTGNTPRSTLVSVKEVAGVSSGQILNGTMNLHDGVALSPTPLHYQNALDAVRYIDLHILHPAGVTDAAIHALFSAHCNFMSNTIQRRERTCIVGAGSKENVSQLANRASILNSGRMQIVAPGITTYNDDGVLVSYSGAYLAAQKCGITAGLDISEPSTHKYLPGVTALSMAFLYSDIDALIQGGICVAELERDTGAFRIVRDVTTWIVDNTLAEYTIQRIVDNLSINMRRSLELIAVGKGITRTLLSRVKAETKRVLEDHKQRDIIFDYANIVVDHDFDQIFVAYQVAPVFPANFVLITQFFVPRIVTIANAVNDSAINNAVAGFFEATNASTAQQASPFPSTDTGNPNNQV